MNTLILYATSQGNAESLSHLLADLLSARGHHAEVRNIATQPPADLALEFRPIVFCASTWGEGDPPDDALEFWDDLQRVTDNSLALLRYAVYALGDRNYDEFCGFGRKLDECLAAKGAIRLVERVDNDVDFEEHLPDFSAALITALTILEQAQPQLLAA